MIVRVLLFAEVRERVGTGEISLEMLPSGRVADLRSLLSQTYPRVAEMLPRCQIARNGVLVTDAEELHLGDELAVLPPVSGG
ncbi:MAG: MoaD/ThiS family protein [Gemmataceae bacterium]